MRDPEAEIAEAGPDSLVLVMTHDHPLDMAITAAALRRDFPYVGLIGSATKRARFEKRFREIGTAGGDDPLPRLPHRAPRHRRQGPGGDRRLRDRAAAAGAARGSAADQP